MAVNYVNSETRKSNPPRTPRVLERMRLLYERREKLSVVGTAGNASDSRVTQLARKHGWKRSPQAHAPAPLTDIAPKEIGVLRARWERRLPGLKEAIRRAAQLP